MKVNIKNSKKVHETIEKAEGKANARTANIFDINNAVESVEKKLNALEIPKKFWVGCKIEIKPESVANSYKYQAEGTYIKLERFSTGWFMVSAFRSNCSKKAYGGDKEVTLSLSALAKDSIPKNFKI